MLRVGTWVPFIKSFFLCLLFYVQWTASKHSLLLLWLFLAVTSMSLGMEQVLNLMLCSNGIGYYSWRDQTQTFPSVSSHGSDCGTFLLRNKSHWHYPGFTNGQQEWQKTEYAYNCLKQKKNLLLGMCLDFGEETNNNWDDSHLQAWTEPWEEAWRLVLLQSQTPFLQKSLSKECLCYWVSAGPW